MSLYKMKLGEVVVVEDSGRYTTDLHTTAMRVPGGWIYRSYDKTNQVMAAVFVRYDNEFDPVRPIQGTAPDRLKHCHVCQKDVRVIEKMGGTICAECRVILGQ